MTRVYTKGEVRNIINYEVKRMSDFVNGFGFEGEINSIRWDACNSLNKEEYTENEVREIRNEVSKVILDTVGYDF